MSSIRELLRIPREGHTSIQVLREGPQDPWIAVVSVRWYFGFSRYVLVRLEYALFTKSGSVYSGKSAYTGWTLYGKEKAKTVCVSPRSRREFTLILYAPTQSKTLFVSGGAGPVGT